MTVMGTVDLNIFRTMSRSGKQDKTNQEIKENKNSKITTTSSCYGSNSLYLNFSKINNMFSSSDISAATSWFIEHKQPPKLVCVKALVLCVAQCESGDFGR